MKFLVSGDALFSSSNLDKTMDPELLALLQGADEAFTNAEFVTPRLNTAPRQAAATRPVCAPRRWTNSGSSISVM